MAGAIISANKAEHRNPRVKNKPFSSTVFDVPIQSASKFDLGRSPNHLTKKPATMCRLFPLFCVTNVNREGVMCAALSKRIPGRKFAQLQITNIDTQAGADAGSDRHQNGVAMFQHGHAQTTNEIG